jgi:hypothetical protein
MIEPQAFGVDGVVEGLSRLVPTLYGPVQFCLMLPHILE